MDSNKKNNLFKCVVFDINKIRKDFNKRAKENINEMNFLALLNKKN